MDFSAGNDRGRQRHTTEHIINKLRKAEVLSSQGRSISEAAEELAVSEAARAKIEQWRREYNEFRPHSSLGNKTPSEFALDQGILNPAC